MAAPAIIDPEQNTYDAIVIGSGISGGWAAKELCEKGMKTLVLERGRDVKHGDYPTAFMEPWDFQGRTRISNLDRAKQEKQSRTGYTTAPASAHWFVDDLENPYSEEKRFDWMRGYHVGGRSLLWGRQSYRWGDLDFEANAREGVAVDWPIRYQDVSPWYDYVERFVGISGSIERLPQLPDGQFLPAMELNCLEQDVKARIAKSFGGRVMTIGRVANLTQPHLGRGVCMSRNRCIRGCPYGAYFSSNASTLPAAYATGNLTLRPFSIVNQLVYDADRQRATGVRVIDAQTGEMIEYRARIIFSCASTVASTFILLNSTSDRFPKGMGNDSGELGHNLMDHHFKVGATGISDGFADRYYRGQRPNGIYIPRFRNLTRETQRKDYRRGFGYQGSASRSDWTRPIKELNYFGSKLKADLIAPGPWRMGLTGFGECLPYHENRMFLNSALRDKWGRPTVTFNCEWKANEAAMRDDMITSAVDMLEAAGLKNVTAVKDWSSPGLGIHEMGTARMGRDPKTSVLNEWNQVHGVPNVFVTDGSCMTSAACVNPSLTYMALTARACDHAEPAARATMTFTTTKPVEGLLTRREAIQRAAVLLGFAISPSILTGVMRAQDAAPSERMRTTYLSSRYLDIAGSVVDRILPRTSTPGALEVGVLSFVDLMYGEFMTPEERRRFVAGLEGIEAASIGAYQRGFASLASARQDIVIQAVAETTSQDDKSFFMQIKELTIVGYFTSEHVAKNILRYEPVPGPYQGCVPLSEVGRATWTPMR